MSRRRRQRSKKPGDSPVSEDRSGQKPREPSSDEAPEEVSVGNWQDEQPFKRRTFPGPRDADAKLRVAVDRAAYAEVVAHAKEPLDAEICGVLVGAHCKDDGGPFVHVEAAVRGTQAEEGSVHVTYTQETWNAIYATIEREQPKLQIVGWYHSHPGFGVEFPNMDVFIQKNFFSGPTQIGLVTDPLGGGVAICKNADKGIDYIDRFWVDGRLQRCEVPGRRESEITSGGGATDASTETIGALETRISQLVHVVDEMRQSFYRWLTMLGMLVAVVVVFFIANQIFYMIFPSTAELPKGVSFAPVPVIIDGKPCLLGVRIVNWKIPPELIAAGKEDKSSDEEKDQQESTSGEQKSNARTAENKRPADANRAGTGMKRAGSDQAETDKAATKP